jgi:hypothetical protein
MALEQIDPILSYKKKKKGVKTENINPKPKKLTMFRDTYGMLTATMNDKVIKNGCCDKEEVYLKALKELGVDVVIVCHTWSNIQNKIIEHTIKMN